MENDVEKKSEGHGIRAKRLRITSSCSKKLAMLKKFDDADNLLTVRLYT